MENHYTGQILIASWGYSPVGSIFCEGQYYPINNSEFAALYSLIGNTYGGDPRLNFAIPDLRGRSAIGSGKGPGLPDYKLGRFRGANSVSLHPYNLPAHKHDITATGGFWVGGETVKINTPANHYLGESDSTDPIYRTSGSTEQLGGAQGVNVAISGGGSGEPINIQNPYLAVSFCIVYNGIYPPRT